MYFVDFEANGKNYKLRLNTRAIVQLEKKIGCNPLAIFGSDGEQIPTVSVMVSILTASLSQFQHGISETEAYQIFDEWLNDGNTVTDFIKVIVDIYKVSGLLKDEADTQNNEISTQNVKNV